MVHAGWQVGQETSGHRHRFFFGFGQVVDRPITTVDAPIAEIFFGDFVSHCMTHDRRAGNKQLGGVAHHYREVSEHGFGCAQANHAAEQHVHDGDGGELFGVHRATQVPWQERAATAGDTRSSGLDRAAALFGCAVAGLLLLRDHAGHAAATARPIKQAY